MSYPPSGPSGWERPDPRLHRPPQQPGPPRPAGSWGAPPPPPPPPEKDSTGLIIGAIVGVAVVIVGAVIAVTVASGSGNDAGGSGVVAESATDPSTGESSEPSADEVGVQAAAEKRVGLINDQDAVGLHRMACDADARSESTAGYQELFDDNPAVSATIDVRDVRVDGRVGTVEGVMSIDQDSGDVTWSFMLQAGEWRFCPSLSGHTDDIITG